MPLLFAYFVLMPLSYKLLYSVEKDTSERLESGGEKKRRECNQFCLRPKKSCAVSSLLIIKQVHHLHLQVNEAVDLCRMQYRYSFLARSKCFQGLPNPCIRTANQSIHTRKRLTKELAKLKQRVFLIPPKFAVTKKKLSVFNYRLGVLSLLAKVNLFLELVFTSICRGGVKQEP